MRSTRAEIHLDRLIGNIQNIRKHVGKERLYCFPVKADAYGHGAVECSVAALDCGVEYLAIATLGEARELRQAGILAPIILFSIANEAEIRDLVELSLEPFVGDKDYIYALAQEAEKEQKVLNVHLKIDTGMGRIGCKPEEAAELALLISQSSSLSLTGTCTHFPVSDSSNQEFTKKQIQIFNEAISAITSAGCDPGLLHTANSGAVVAHPDAWFDMVRPGMISYGYYSSDEQERVIELEPVMDFKSKISFLKEVEPGTSISYGRTWKAEEKTWIGTMPVGYGDGYNRLLSNNAEVLHRGKRIKIAGRVCMDQTMINLGPETDAHIEDDVLLFGKDGPDAEEIAEILGTIPYEVCCWVGKRVPRVFFD
jgi:alanine racemase